MLHLLLAPNAFKHSLDAHQVAEALRDGFLQSRLECQISLFPVGDGGDGTCKLLHEKLGGKRITKTVSGPLGKPTHASYSLIDKGKTAVIEMADASGIWLIETEDRAPLHTSSKGTGELIRDAVERHQVSHIILGMGGSATVDGGCGMLHALGVRFLDGKGHSLDPIPEQLRRIEGIDTSGLHKNVLDANITILCDVKNYLLGENGAAYVFGPQKGASSAEVEVLDSFLSKLRNIVLKATGRDMASIVSGGTAGGAAAGMYALLNAQLVNGISYFLQKTGFENTLTDINWLITGEGSLDEQTLEGKAPMGVASLAKKYGIPVIGIAGSVPLQPSPKLLDYFDVLLPISHEAMSLGDAIVNTELNLRRTGQALGNILALQNGSFFSDRKIIES